MESQHSIGVFDYLDYRKFLADYYRAKKAVNKSFSHRLFARKAGFRSTGFFSEVLSGKRKLSREYARKFAQALNLDEKEREFFDLLVAFTHAPSHAARDTLYDLLLKALPVKIQQMRQSQREYFSKWYYVAVREALAILPVHDDFAALAAALQPAITAAQAKAAVHLLHQLGLVEKDAAGRWRASQLSLVAPQDEATALLRRSFQDAMLVKAREALERVPPDQRDISCVTFSVSPAGMDRVKALVQEFHRQVIAVVQADRGEDRVMQMNLQLFPLTRTGSEHAPE